MTETSGSRQAKPVTICCYCRKRIYRVKNGEWSDRRATPVEIEVDR